MASEVRIVVTTAIAVALAAWSGSMVAAASVGPIGPGLEPRVETAPVGRAGARDPRTSGGPDDASSARRPWPDVSLSGKDPYITSTLSPTVTTETRLAQFQLPQSGPRDAPGPAQREARELAKELDFQYSFGSDTEYTYDRNPDLNNRLRDNLQFLAPTVFFLWTTRPTQWLDVNLGVTFEQQFRIREETITRLPDGTQERALSRGGTAKLDVANIVIKNIPDHPLDITLGRMTFEDPRLFLYDVTLDGVHVKFKGGSFNTEASYTREDVWDFTVFDYLPKSSIKNLILYHEYRGIEDHKIAAYAIARLDRLPRSEGRFKLYGVRAYGRPADEYNYWAEIGVARGVDEAATPQPLRGTAFDLGGTYRFPKLPFAPCLTVGLAYGSGDGDSRDGVNTEYRQTGFQSNETKFCGVAQFKRYGEFVDPELSNLRVYTLGIGFRPSANFYVDLVHHQFKLNHFATEIRNAAITAQMNRITALRTLDVGREVDLILAFRRLFGTKLGIDLRIGRFFPGSAFVRNDGTRQNPVPRDPDRGLKVLAVLSY